MNKKYLWKLLTIVTVAMMSATLTSCKGDDEENGPKTEKPDYGKDGLKGYWMEEPTTQRWMKKGNLACYFFYLDGQGGGTRFYPSGGWDSNRFSTTYQEAEGGVYGSIAYTKLFKTVKDEAGNTYTLYTFDSGKHWTEPIIYTRAGTTLVFDSGSKYNVDNGSIIGYKRVTIVN